MHDASVRVILSFSHLVRLMRTLVPTLFPRPQNPKNLSNLASFLIRDHTIENTDVSCFITLNMHPIR